MINDMCNDFQKPCLRIFLVVNLETFTVLHTLLMYIKSHFYYHIIGVPHSIIRCNNVVRIRTR